MRHALLPLLLLSASPAYALDACQPTPDDPQVRVCTYRPGQRYQINGLVGFVVNIRVSPDETAKHLDPAYTGRDKDGNPVATWSGPDPKKPVDVGRYKNNVPVWPFAAGHSAMVLVTTRPDGSERSYQFDLNARPAAETCDAANATRPGCAEDTLTTASLAFVYPDDVAEAKQREASAKKAALAVAVQARHAKQAEATALDRLKADTFYGPINRAYQAVGETKYRALAPSHVEDNGQFTTMQWPANVSIPTIAVIDPATHEPRTLSVASQGQIRIIPQTAEWFRLVLGKDAVLDIHNLHWSPERPDPRTGTTSPDVVRQIHYSDSPP